MTGNGAPDLRGVGTPKRSQHLLLPSPPLNSNANANVQNLSAWARRMLGRVVKTRPALMNLGNFYHAPGVCRSSVFEMEMVDLGSSGNTTFNEILASIKAMGHTPTKLSKGSQSASDGAIDCRAVLAGQIQMQTQFE